MNRFKLFAQALFLLLATQQVYSMFKFKPVVAGGVKKIRELPKVSKTDSDAFKQLLKSPQQPLPVSSLKNQPATLPLHGSLGAAASGKPLLSGLSVKSRELSLVQRILGNSSQPNPDSPAAAASGHGGFEVAVPPARPTEDVRLKTMPLEDLVEELCSQQAEASLINEALRDKETSVEVKKNITGIIKSLNEDIEEKAECLEERLNQSTIKELTILNKKLGQKKSTIWIEDPSDGLLFENKIKHEAFQLKINSILELIKTKKAAQAEAEAETKVKAEAEAKQKAEAETKAKADAEAKAKAEAAAKAKAEKERLEKEAKTKADAEAKAKAEAEAKAKAEAEAKAKAEAETKAKADAAAKAKADAEAKAKAEAEAKAKADAEAKAKAEAETKAKAELEAKQKAEAEAKAKADAEAKAKAETEAKADAEAEAKAKAEAEAKAKAEAETKAKADAEAKAKAEAEAKAKADAEAKAEAEARKKHLEDLQKASITPTLPGPTPGPTPATPGTPPAPVTPAPAPGPAPGTPPGPAPVIPAASTQAPGTPPGTPAPVPARPPYNPIDWQPVLDGIAQLRQDALARRAQYHQ